MVILKFCNRIIEYSFYALFFLIPLVFAGNTSELFELNKMWLTWGLTIIIGAFWFTKMILQRRIFIQRTPLDIPIALFLLSQIISTIFSWDRYISFWGYYSRFNGGLLSTLTYIFLYYALVSNLSTAKVVLRIIFVSLTSGLIVALWGLPSHFGYDPTCFIFRGNFDVSCWTADFIPRARIFSTLGQPAWLAAYFAVLIPIAIAFAIKNSNIKAPNLKQRGYGVANPPQNDVILASKRSLRVQNLFRVSNFGFVIFLLLSALFYIDLLFTFTRAGVLGLWFSLIFFFFVYIWVERKNLKSLIVNSKLLIVVGIFLIITFIIGTPIPQINNFTLPVLRQHFEKTETTAPETIVSKDESRVSKNPQTSQQQSVSGGTESTDIRLLVWEGGLEAWKNNPIFGTGVETFAFAYYKYKPPAHNLTSEWNFLYNKAHNEYVNYLTTTGAFGLGTYLLMIGWFLFLTFRKISKSEFIISNQIPNPKSQLVQLEISSIRNLIPALIAGYLSILITNFFGFSVVITNIYLFLIPAFVFILRGTISQNTTKPTKVNYTTTIWQWTPIFLISMVSLYMLVTLFNFWRADLAYAKGYNLNRSGEYQLAYKELHKAVELRGGESVFKDELSINNAILAVALLSDPNTKDDPETISTATNLAREAIATNDQITSDNPNNVVFWKSKVRLFFTLSQVDSRYMAKALEAIEIAAGLAPNDANILYNLGVLYGQNNKIAKGIEALEKTIALKPDYKDAYYALGLFYHEQALDKEGKVIDSALQNKAVAQMKYILTNISSTDTQAQESLKTWENK